MNVIEKFKKIASEDRFRGWPLVGEPVLGEIIPFFGQSVSYHLRTGNGIEEYTSILRHFGWSVTFGITKDNDVVTLVQWKPGVNEASWELPPGGIGKIKSGTSAEEILSVTKDVYLKETGYGNGSWSYLGSSIVETGKFRGSGIHDHGLPAHMFIATDLEKIASARQPNRNEIIETLLVPLSEFDAAIDSGLFKEISALTCALLALRKIAKEKR